MAQRRPTAEEFSAFARTVEPKLRYALVARCGAGKGLEATQDALVFAWEHWEKIQSATNPAGYLFRVAQRGAFRVGRPLPLLCDIPAEDPPPTEPGLAQALQQLSKQQRTAVALIDGFGWTHQEVAELTGVGRSTVQKHHERGLAKLRHELGVTIDA